MKLTDKLNRPIRDVRISLTDRCNFRCTYCMPKEAGPYPYSPEEDILSAGEIVLLCNALQPLGLQKIRLTGGEPLLRQDLLKIISELSRLNNDLDLSLTTNGFNLEQMAKPLKLAGLSRVTVSLDSLNPVTFRQISGTTCAIEKVLAGIDACLTAGFDNIKINMVVMRGINDHEVTEFIRYFIHKQVTVRFIEYMDVGSKNNWSRSRVVPTAEVFSSLSQTFELTPIKALYTGEVAERYLVNGGTREIGFISSITRPFCQHCHRLRVTAKGELVGCLFSNAKFSILQTLRPKPDEALLKEHITRFWLRRDDQYSVHRKDKSQFEPNQKIEMYQVGG